MNREWTKCGCTQWMEIDITDEIKTLLTQFGDAEGHSFRLVIADGEIRLDEIGGSGGATLFCTPRLPYCLICGAFHRT